MSVKWIKLVKKYEYLIITSGSECLTEISPVDRNGVGLIEFPLIIEHLLPHKNHSFAHQRVRSYNPYEENNLASIKKTVNYS